MGRFLSNEYRNWMEMQTYSQTLIFSLQTEALEVQNIRQMQTPKDDGDQLRKLFKFQEYSYDPLLALALI